MINCKQASQFISASLDRHLTLRERFALKLHLLLCKYCKRFSQQLQSMRVAMTLLARSIENDTSIMMPEATKNRITLLVENVDLNA